MAKGPVQPKLPGYQDPGQQYEAGAPIQVTNTPSDPQFYDQQLGGQLPIGYWDRLSNRLSDAMKNFPVTKLGDMIRLDEIGAKGGPKVDPNQLNRQYPWIDQPFTEPTTQAVADEIAARAQDRHEMGGLDALGPHGFFASGTIGAAGILAGAVDPLFLGVSGITGGLLGAAGQSGSAYARVLARNPFLTNLAKGAVDMAIPEAVSGVAKTQEQQDYSSLDYLTGVASGAFGYAGLHWALPKAVQFLRYGAEKAGLLAEKTAISQLLMDRPVNVDPIVHDVAQERVGGALPDRLSNVAPYGYSPIDTNQPLGSRAFYHGTPDSRGDFASSRKIPIGTDYGDGIYLTDNPTVANGQAASKFENADGRIYQAAIADNSKLLDLEKPLPEDAKAVLDPILKEVFGADVPEGLTGRQALDEIKQAMADGKLDPRSYDTVQQKLGASGYDGYRSEGGDVLGQRGDPHNIVQMFDQQQTGDAAGKIVPGDAYAPDRSVVPQISRADAEQLAQSQSDPKNSVMFDSQEFEDFKKYLNQPSQPVLETNDFKDQETELLEEAHSLEQQGLLGPEARAELQRIQESAKDQVRQEQIIKAATFCLGRDI